MNIISNKDPACGCRERGLCIFAAWAERLRTEKRIGGNMGKIGKHSFQLPSCPRIVSSAAFVGPKEGAGPLGSEFDVVIKDDTLGLDS
ncbi:MAG: hypothetical protein IK064_05560, partial [Clostridia bacterium]|nr:hypothetical protein [Clostridia bacterium]